MVVSAAAGFDSSCTDFVGVEVDPSSCPSDADEVDIGRGLPGPLDSGWSNTTSVSMSLSDSSFNGVFSGDFDVSSFWRDAPG